MAPPASEKYMALVGMVALLTAGLLLLARVFKLGFLADFLSRTVLVGFLTGVGFQVGIAMLGDMLGVDVLSHRTLGQLWEVLRGLPRSCSRRSGCRSGRRASILLGHRVRAAVSGFAVCGCRDDCGERTVPLRRTRHSPSSARSPAGCRRSDCRT